jgi:predicted deacylase
MGVQILHGRRDGPTVWLSAAVHGDEILGVEVIRRVLQAVDVRSLGGTILAVPIVNVHGFNTGDRYLPDRRDLNRAFPGSARGSFAARLAKVLMDEVVAPSDIGIDLHTGSLGRSNLPQVRGELADARTLELARVFGTPVMVDATTRDGSLRQVATERGKTVLLYEGGEALRFDERAIDAATAGVLRVLAHLGMVSTEVPPGDDPAHASGSGWVRAGRSGIVHVETPLGDRVTKGQLLARVLGPHGERHGRLSARHDGIVIGLAQHPLVNRGDAVVHVARLDDVA